MNIRLKYLLPIIVFFIGITFSIMQAFFEFNYLHEKMIESASMQARITGNRISNQITIRQQGNSIDKFIIRETISSYMVENVNQIDILDSDHNVLFSQYVSTHGHDTKNKLNKEKSIQVLKSNLSIVEYQEDSHHILGYFPAKFNQNRVDNFKLKGILFLVIDIEKEYTQLIENIYYIFLSNLLLMLILSSIISIFMYIFIFKRLTQLHNTTKKIIQGDIQSLHVEQRKDELGDVIDTFNSMVDDINIYKTTMEEKVNTALDEYKKQTKIMINQNRQAAMGEMIGNIAHQWRQPLNALGLIVQKINIQFKKNKLTEENIQTSTTNAVSLIDNMSQTIDDFRNFFKPDKEKESFSLEGSVYSAVNLLESAFNSEDISIELQLSETHNNIIGYKNEFIQVLLNILNNAKDALQENDIHNKVIIVKSINLQDKSVVTISDNAGGIDNDAIDKIFDPYFTTKDEGKGTGIGLYMSKVIIEDNMHGEISVKNTSQGAEFTIIFNTKENK